MSQLALFDDPTPIRQEIAVSPAPTSRPRRHRDPRLDELRRVGLQRVWVEIAEQIGVDAFLTAWRLLDADASCSDDGTNLRIPLRRYSAFLRFQRNRYIETLAASGMTPTEIQQRIARQLCERLTVRHIQRLIPRGENRA